MKAKTISAILSKKFKYFLDSIEDEAVKGLVERNTIITGGCITSMLLGEPVNDYDLYFTNKETAKAVATYYASRFQPKNSNGIVCPVVVTEDGDRVKIKIQSAGIASENGTSTAYQYFETRPENQAGEYVSQIMNDPGAIEDAYDHTKQAALQVGDEDGKPKYRPVFMSTNAITLSHQIQIILRFYGDAEEIHKNYDFIHCTNYWTSADKKLVLNQAALEAILARELRYVGSLYPIASMFRIRKFIKRGWSINAGQILKMVMQLAELDLKNVAVLEDQLTGVDVAYFLEVIEKVKEKDPEKVNSAYLVEIINRMF